MTWFCSIHFRYLLDKGANIQAVNNDGELAIDLAEGKEMEALITNTMERLGNILDILN